MSNNVNIIFDGVIVDTIQLQEYMDKMKREYDNAELIIKRNIRNKKLKTIGYK